MDAQRFDRLARVLSSRATRRGVLGALLGLAGAAAVTSDDAAAGGFCRELGLTCNSTNLKCCPKMTCSGAGTKRCIGQIGAPGCGTNNALCGTGLVCKNNFCAKRLGQIGETCRTTGKNKLLCDTGLTCKSGKCALPCVADGAETCTVDADCCTAGSYCSDGVCLPACCSDDNCIKDYEGNVHCFGDFESADPPDEVICTTNAACASIYGDCGDADSPCICVSGAVNDIFFDFDPPDNRGYCYQLFL